MKLERDRAVEREMELLRQKLAGQTPWHHEPYRVELPPEVLVAETPAAAAPRLPPPAPVDGSRRSDTERFRETLVSHKHIVRG